jgi:hypothetical protein
MYNSYVFVHQLKLQRTERGTYERDEPCPGTGTSEPITDLGAQGRNYERCSLALFGCVSFVV